MKANTELLSAMNRSAILEFLCTKGPCSRADISRELGISFPAVSSNVKALIAANLAVEIGEGNNALGRKATLVAFNANWAYLVGVDIGRRHIRTMCADISGEIKSYHRIRYNKEDIYQAILDAVQIVVVEAQISMDDVACIGVGIPGIYDEKRNVHMLAPFIEGWNVSELFPRLKAHYASKQLFFENSVNLGAIGEWWKGCAHGYDSVVYMEYGVGFGAAILQNGKILRGANGAAGEIGYMTVERQTLRDAFQSEGSLEQIIPSALIDRRILDSGTENPIQLNIVLEALKKEMPSEQIEKIPQYFAMSIINTVAVINPEIVVISGRLGTALYQYYQKEIQELLKAHVPFPPIVCCSALDEKANVIGAIELAERQVVKNNKNIASI